MCHRVRLTRKAMRAACPQLDSEAGPGPFEPMATTLIRTRVDARRAAAAKKILAGLGLDATSAVNMLFAQIVARRGLPFAVQEDGYAYAQSEYGVTPAELDAAAKRIKREAAAARRRGETLSVPADWRELRKKL